MGMDVNVNMDVNVVVDAADCEWGATELDNDSGCGCRKLGQPHGFVQLAQ